MNDIDEINFPNIIKYDYEVTKTIEIFYVKDFNVIFDDDKVYVQIDSILQKRKDIISNIISFFSSIMLV